VTAAADVAGATHSSSTSKTHGSSRSGGGGGGWTTKLAGVAEERGTWEGAPIPPLECVIETKWPDSCVTWEGSDPLL
jgi:hypothetical protein